MSSFSRFGFRKALAVAVSLVAVGAGMFGGGCSSGPDLSSESSFCEAVAQADCNANVVQACYMPSATTAANDTNLCIGVAATPERCNPLNAPFNSNPNFTQACLDAHTALYANAPTIDPTLLAAKITACEAVFNFGGQTDAPCKLDTDCDVGDGFNCVVHAGGAGSCQVPIAIAAGESCNGSASQCGSGFYCGSGHCISNNAVGEPCGAGTLCDGTVAFCSIPTSSSGGKPATTGTCKALLNDQSACTDDSQCQGGFCIAEDNGSLCAGSPAPLSFDTPSCTTTFAN
jgi:hypothetical protein